MDDGTEYPVTGTLVLGRSDDCDIRLSSGKVSRQHARVALTDEGLLVEDLGSANGTRVNGMALTQPAALMHGDTLAIDEFQFRVLLESGPAPGTVEDATELAEPGEEATELAASPPDEQPLDKAPQNLPGSWVEGVEGEHTEFFGADSVPEEISVARHSDLPHLVLLDEAGSVQAVFELEAGGADGEQAWIIGREADCDLVVEDPTVSTRHAQLVCGNGRWRMVNLVSSNGIIVNGEKRLTVYLGSGDTVQLGRSRLIFFDSADAAAAGVAVRPSAKQGPAERPERGRGIALWLLLGAVLLAGCLAAYYFLGAA